MQQKSAVVQFPGGLCRSREAERLVDRWLVIQAMPDAADRVAALFEWRLDMQGFSSRWRAIK